jgi:hypothetical protein
VIEQFEHVLQQTHLSFVGWGKIGMAAFGTVSQVPVSIPGEEGYTEPRAWGDNCDGSSANRFANINRLCVAGPQDWHSPGDGLKIIDEQSRLGQLVSLPLQEIPSRWLEDWDSRRYAPLLRERREGTSFAREDRQVSFGSADISCNQHCNSSCLRL